jgi:class 3 adenylate cyclase/tetratricopeptide (TPR) repeat protein
MTIGAAPTRATGASLQVPLPLQDMVEERRRVTVLFADLQGSTKLASRRDPEDTRDFLRSYFTKLGRRIQRFGGTIDKYVGDAVMAVFGAPVAHEDDPERALSAALAIRDAVEELNRELRASHGFEVAVRIGVNTGDVVAGTICGEVQAAYTVVGDTVNVAQRLEASAPPGEILVGAATYSATAHAFEFEPVAALQVKGKDLPIAAYRLVRAKPALAAARPLAMHRVTSPLVGRDTELAALVSLVWSVKAGRGGIAAVVGEAGAGKSRLIAEAKRAAAGAGVTWLEGRCFTLGSTTRYAPFVEIVTSAAGIVATDGDAARWSKLEAAVRIAAPGEVEDTLPYLAALVGIAAPPPHAEQLSRMTSEAVGRQIFRVTRRFLTGLARRQPLVVVFEDLHWADASTAALIEHVLRASRDAPALVVGTGRPEQTGSARDLRDRARREYREGFSEILLSPLSDEMAAILIGNLLAVDELPAPLRDLIVRRAEGNPLYVEEIIRSLIEARVVRRDESTRSWRAVADHARIEIPDTINALILSRIDRLDERSKEVLRSAAVIGRSFRERLLRAVVPDGATDAIADLIGADILIVRTWLPDTELMFKHALFQEAIYGSILKRQRGDMHCRVAAAIEATFGDALEQHVAALAYHYARAEDWENAVAYLERAGDQAGRVAADADAVERYREALRACDATGRAQTLQLASLERKLGEAQFRAGLHMQATVSLGGALRRLGETVPATPGATRRAIAREIARQLGHIVLPFRLPRPTLSSDPAVDERSRAYSILGQIDYYAAEGERLLLWSLRLLNMGERAGHVMSIVQGQLGIGIACDVTGLLRLGRWYQQRNVRIAEASGDPVAIAYANTGLAHHDHATGDWDASEAHWARATEPFWNVRELRRWAGTNWGVALMRIRRGDPRSARALAERQLEVADEAGDQVVRAWGLLCLGRSQWTIGEDAAALASLYAAAQILRAVPDRQILVRVLGDIGWCLLRRGELDGATTVLEEARELMARYRIRGYHSTVMAPLAVAYLEQADRAPSDARDQWHAKAGDALQMLRKQASFDAEAQPIFRRVRGRYEWALGRRSRAEAEWRAALARAEELRFAPEIALTHFEIGRATGRAAHLEQAARIFDEMGASADAARARALQTATT